MKIIDMRLSDREGNMKAFFKVETAEGLVIDGFKIMDGRNGLFASMPSKRVGERWLDMVTGPREIKDELTRLALESYQEVQQAPVRSSPASPLLPAMPDEETPF